MMRAPVPGDVGQCRICGERGMCIGADIFLCSECSLVACAGCLRARCKLVSRWWSFGLQRWECPVCHWHSKWLR
jgi:hypothetical protein